MLAFPFISRYYNGHKEVLYMQKEMLQAHNIMGIIYNSVYIDKDFDFELFHENRTKLGELLVYSKSVGIPLRIIRHKDGFTFYLLQEESPLIDEKSNVIISYELNSCSLFFKDHAMADINRIITDLKERIETNVILKREAVSGFSQYDMRENFEEYVNEDDSEFEKVSIDTCDNDFSELDEDTQDEELCEDQPLW